jgi:hypothetical protein
MLIFGGAALLLAPKRLLADLCLRDQKAPDGKTRTNPLPDALRRARARGVDVLAIVIPADDAEKYKRGHQLGEWLNWGVPEELAPLADVELICATHEELGLPPSKDPPMMWRIDANERVRPRAQEKFLADGKPLGDRLRVVKRRYVDEPPPGSHWANSWGCGTRVEDTAEEKRLIAERAKQGKMRRIVSIGCGMGHVPEKSQRFLYYFAHSLDDSEVE